MCLPPVVSAPLQERVLHAAFFVLGMGLMAPLTAILQTMDYLNIFFAQFYPSRTLYTAYNTCNLIALVILFKWGDRLWPNKRSRMVTGYSLYTIILMCLPLVSGLCATTSRVFCPGCAHEVVHQHAGAQLLALAHVTLVP